MVSFTLSIGTALFAATALAAAMPPSFEAPALSSDMRLEARQAEMPEECTEYCSVAAGCVCITRPTNCVATYIVDSGETCGTVVDRFSNFTATDLLKWNPEIGKECFGLRAYVPVCIGVPGYEYPGPVEGGDIWTPEQVPVPVMPGIVENCTSFQYTDSTGVPTLGMILSENNITRTQWNSWNFPTQDPTQEWAVWAGYFSCIKA